jgi:GAF domain-containing protein/HAMP domain-containing protein
MRFFSLNDYLARLGGWYIILVIAIAQLTAIPGAFLGTLSIQLNAEFDSATMVQISRYTPIVILLGNLILLAVAWSITPKARKRLSDWSRNQLSPNPEEEAGAWREITSMTWRYGVIAIFVAFGVDIVPSTLYYFFQGVTTAEQMFYSLIGGLVSVLAIIIIAILVIERLMIPARLVLVPSDFNRQLSALAGPRLTFKFQALIFILLIIGILMVAPIGYHYMLESLMPEKNFLKQAYQFEVILVSSLSVGIGLGLAYFISRTISVPLRDLIATFQAVEAGDLSQRVPVTTTDEIAEVTMHFNQMVASLEELQTTLEKQVDERTRLLKATNDLAKVSSSILDPDELLSKVINLFTEQFNYYYAAIYLVDPAEKWAELREATGEAGKVLRQNRHRHELTGKSMVASCIRERMPRIAQNASEEKQRIENPLLPYTRSEVALPLIVGDRVLGALNVQSTKVADFGLSVIETMQNMAGQVAVALENARLFQETSQRIQEMRAIQQQYLREGWSALTMNKDELEYGVGEPNINNTQQIVTPINLRDQIIGEITIEGSETWTADQRNLVDAVAVQAAVALENARLVNESRQIAIRERMLAEINSKIWASNTLDGVLQTAIKELGRRLDASSATIELNLDDEQ